MSSTLVSCSGGKPTAKLEISRAFAVNGGQFDGGLVVHGFSNSGKKVTLSIQGSYQKSYSLDADTWTFYAIGWDGPNKFAGVPYCGKSSPQDIKSNPTVSINVSTAGCDAAFSSTVGLRNTKAIACSTFYKYSLSNDSWTPITSADSNSVCRTGATDAPMGFGTDDYNFKVVAVDLIDGVETEVFESPCLDADGIDSAKLPNKLFPFIIKGYRTWNECQNNVSNFQKFSFKNGLEAAGSDFTHLTHVSGAFPSEQARLVLPSSVTRTGFSTFTSLIPSILCGTSPSGYSECNADVTDGVDVYVPWNQNPSGGDHTIERKTALTSCPANLLDSSFKFSLYPGSCSVSDKQLKARVHVNHLVCQPSGMFTNVKDIDRVGNKIFILKNFGATDWVDIYSDKGLFLGNLSTFYDDSDRLAVSNTSAGVYKIAIHNSVNSPYGRVHVWDETMGEMSHSDITLPSIVDSLEADGESVLYSNGTTIGIRSFSDGNILSPTTYGSINVLDMRIMSGKLFFIDNGTIKWKAWTLPGTIGAGGVMTGFATNLTVLESPTPTIYYVNGSNQLQARRADDDSLQFTSSAIYSSVTDIEVFNGKVFKVSSLNLGVVDKVNNNPISTASDTCDDSITIEGTALAFESDFNDHYRLHENSFRMIGRKYSAAPHKLKNAFRDLSERDNNVYSSGGTLRRVQEHLSANGLGGVLPQYSDCTTLKNTGLLPITGSKIIFDPEENQNFSVTYTVSLSATDLPLFTCVDNDPATGSCSGLDYDIDINFTVAKNGVTDEKGLMRLSCGSKRGLFETKELDGSEISRDLIVWNTQDHQHSRVESFDYHYESSTEMHSSITKIQKVGDNSVFARQVSAGQNGASIHANASEIQYDGSTVVFKQSNINPGSWSASAFTMSPGIDTDFSGQSAESSLLRTDTSVFGADQAASFAISPVFTQTQTEAPGPFTLGMNMAAFENLDQSSTDILKFFTIDP